MNYKKVYDELVQKRLSQKLNKMRPSDENYQYCERHHIVPKCMGGSNDKENLVVLTAREHFIAHLLLAKAYPSNMKLGFALARMLMQSKFNPRGISTNSRRFDYVRKIVAKARSMSQRQKVWIKNVIKNEQMYWARGKPLTVDMIRDGWCFGKLPPKNPIKRDPSTYVGMTKDKYIHITNGIDHKWWMKSKPIPDGWYQGIGSNMRGKISRGHKNADGTTTNKKRAYNLTTREERFFSPDEELPNGWVYGSIRIKPHRVFTPEEDQFIMTHYIDESVRFCNTTKPTINYRIRKLKKLYPNFVPLKRKLR